MALEIEAYRVRDGQSFDLHEVDPGVADALSDKERAVLEKQRDADHERLIALQDRLFAERRQALLVILLAIDTGGKDSTVRRVFGGVNPAGCVVQSFNVPTPEERAHDFLWRIHQRLPASGMVGIFNRSHYEDVTVPVVNGDIDQATVKRRYDHIREFERLLTESGTTVIKFHLRISKAEQAKRLLERIDEPEKHWKFNPGDLDVRVQWDAYQHAFQRAINATSTKQAPWYVVPANAKWYRDVVVAHVVAETLERMNPRYPSPVENIAQYRAALEDET